MAGTLTRDELLAGFATLKAKGLTFADCAQQFGDKDADAAAYAGGVCINDDLELHEPTIISEAEDGAWVLTWSWVRNADVWQGAVDSDGEPCRFVNHYECDACNEHWTDQWSCACNDHCPVCDAEIEPYKSDELNLAGELVA